MQSIPIGHEEVEREITDKSESEASRELKSALFIIAALIIMIIGSWQRWTQPIIDHGREMNLPARVLAGDQLYADVQYLYGPFAPYFNAFLYRLFGIRLSAIHGAGMASAALILLMIFRLARQIMNVTEAMLTAGIVLVICAVKATANYISPYSYGALYALVFSIGSLLCATIYLRSGRVRFIAFGGILAGMAIISKPEMAAAAIGAAGVAVLLRSFDLRKPQWRDGLIYVLPLMAIPALAWGFVLSRVPWKVVLLDNHILFSNMPPQLVYFNRHVSGLLDFPKSFWFAISGLFMFVLWAGIFLLIGSLINSPKPRDWGQTIWRGLGLMLVGLAGWKILVELVRIKSNATPLTCAPIILPAVIMYLIWRLRSDWRRGRPWSMELQVLLMIAVFAQLAIMRFILNVSASGPYAPFFSPVALVVLAYLIFRILPPLLTKSVPLRQGINRGALATIAILIVASGVNSIYRLHSRNTFEIKEPRGRFLTEPPIGQPLAAALSYVRNRTSPEDYVLTLPQATSINFLAERKYPFREEIVHPGFLEGDKELEAIERIKRRNTSMILVVNLLTPEFRDRVFGTDYNSNLMQWVEKNYRLSARFDSDWSRNARLGDPPFFILAFERSDSARDRE